MLKQMPQCGFIATPSRHCGRHKMKNRVKRAQKAAQFAKINDAKAAV
jgi:hypothetical protein